MVKTCRWTTRNTVLYIHVASKVRLSFQRFYTILFLFHKEHNIIKTQGFNGLNVKKM